MAENKGKPSGSVAEDKKDVGKHGDIKEIGRTTGAEKKNLGKQPINASGTHSHKKL
ncbi:MAG: hypothetical protein ACK4UN_12045 [Limisphaerales bacterium]